MATQSLLDAIDWWQYPFLILALLVWPAFYIRSLSRIARDDTRPQIQHFSNLVSFGAVGSWLLSVGLMFMPMLAVLCIMFSIFVSLVALVLTAVAFHPPLRHKRS